MPEDINTLVYNIALRNTGDPEVADALEFLTFAEAPPKSSGAVLLAEFCEPNGTVMERVAYVPKGPGYIAVQDTGYLKPNS